MIVKNICILFILCNFVELSNVKSLDNLGRKLDEFFESSFNSIFKINKLDELFLTLYNTGSFNYLPIDHLQIAQQFSKQLAKEIHKKMMALKKSVKYAENIAGTFYRDPDIKKENVSYINSKELSANDTRLQMNPLFNTPVINNQSSVHIPTEIYKGAKTTLNEIKFMTQLNPAFQENSEVLRYQFFASSIGLLLHFPGMMWRKSGVDMYDVRRRQWYVQGASSSKDVMILIDTSGSMHGISISLTRLAVQKLIDTMGENDYVAVAQFPGLRENKTMEKNPPHLLVNNPDDCEHKNICETCFETFVQASKRNKDYLFRQIQKINAKGRSFLSDALMFAIEQFHKFDDMKKDREYEGANCNRIIVVLTDGDGDYDRDKIREYVNKSPLTKNIRIFMYSVGEEMQSVFTMKNITCDYHGYFGHIRSYGAVSNIIEKFSTVMVNNQFFGNLSSEPASDNELLVNLASVWLDPFLDPKDFPAPGLGLMTSLTMPVYNRTGNATFLGLLGTDMTVAFMQDLVPQFKLGPNGYAFAINTNGFIIFHPELKAQRGWMPDPPNVDLTEIEFNSPNKTELRRMIIDSAASNGTVSKKITISGLIKVSDEIHTYEKSRIYAFSGVPFSSFGVSVVVPLYNKNYMKVSETIKLVESPDCNIINCSIKIKLPIINPTYLYFNANVFIYAEKSLLQLCKLDSASTKSSKTSSGTANIQQRQQTTTTTTKISESNNDKTTAKFLPITTFGSAITQTIPLTNNNNSSALLNNIQDSKLSNSFNGSSSGLSGSKHTMEFINLIKKMRDPDKCSSDIQKRLGLDLYMLNKLCDWLENKQEIDDNIYSLILTTLTGISMVFPQSRKADYKNLFDNPWTSSIVQRAFDSEDKFILYTEPLKASFDIQELKRNSTNMTISKDLMLFRSYRTSSLSGNVPIGVLGMTFKQEKLINLLRSEVICNESRRCYLLDDSGIISAVNHESNTYQVGLFYGDVEPFVMQVFLNESIYQRTIEYDFQASCPKNNEDAEKASSSSSIRTLYNFAKLPLEIINLLLVHIKGIAQILQIFLQFLFFNYSTAQEATATDNKNISCIKKGYRYYLSNESISRSLDLQCTACNLSIEVIKRKSSNYLLISYDNICPNKICKADITSPLLRNPIKDIGPDLCELSKLPKYRSRPTHKCYSFDPDEDIRCSTNKITQDYFILVLLTLLLQHITNN